MLKILFKFLIVVSLGFPGNLINSFPEYAGKAEYAGLAEAEEQIPGKATNVRINAPAPILGGSLDCGLTPIRCIPSEHATAASCAAVTNPGDICLFAPGNYAGWTISRAGTINNTITWLANGAVTINSGGITINADYNRIIGFTITGSTFSSSDPACVPSSQCSSTFIVANGVDGLELWNNTFSNFNDFGVVQQGIPGENHTVSIYVGNTSTGRVRSTDWGHYTLIGSDSIIQYNTMNEADKDFVLFYGPRLRVTNNYGWGPNAGSAAHTDFIQTGWCCSRTLGTEGLVLEANFHTGNPPAPDQHFSNQEILPQTSGNYLSRRNVIYNSASGQGVFDFTSAYFVSELYYDVAAQNSTCGQGCSAIFYRNATHGRFYNGLYVDAWGSVANAEVITKDGSPGGIASHNLFWDTLDGAAQGYFGLGNSDANKITNQNPLLVDVSNEDFHLQAGSPIISNGTALTTVTSGGTGVTSVTVADAGFFRGFNSTIAQYGGNLAEGDIITLGGSTVRILSISGNVLSLSAAVNAPATTPVYYGDSSTPPRGPYPFKSTFVISNSLGYAGGVITATINDPSIVRRVEFYVDDLPVSMDIDPPYQFSTSGYASGSNHSVKAIARPLYASKTLAYTATMNIVVP